MHGGWRGEGQPKLFWSLKCIGLFISQNFHPVKVEVVFQHMKVRLLNRVSAMVDPHGANILGNQGSANQNVCPSMGPGDKSVFESFANTL